LRAGRDFSYGFQASKACQKKCQRGDKKKPIGAAADAKHKLHVEIKHAKKPKGKSAQTQKNPSEALSCAFFSEPIPPKNTAREKTSEKIGKRQTEKRKGSINFLCFFMLQNLL